MTNILVVSAHPDDETMAAGGTLMMYAEQGYNVYVLETTRGEGGEVGDPPLATRVDLAAVREKEVRKAAAILGVQDVLFLPYTDPYMEIGGEAQRIDVSFAEFAEAIRYFIDRIRPETVLTHGSDGEYGHPQHIYTHQATRRALATSSCHSTLMTWGAWYADAVRPEMLNQSDPADIVRDVSPWMEQKVAAAMCHRTQHAMFLRNSNAASVAAMVPHIESFRKWNSAELKL